MTTENIDIRVREDGSRVVKRNLEDLDPAARKAASGIDFLKKALASLGGVLAARELLTLMNTYENLQNRLRSTGLEAQNLTGVYKALLQISNETRSSVEGSIELYSRLAVSTKELGVSQQDLIQFTKSLNQAILLSGASAQEAQAGIIQLSQGIASGTLRGDELRSVLEQLPAVADVIAKSLGVTRGQLRQMGEDGKITAQTILTAFAQARGELDERFAKSVPTLSQSFQVLKNNVLDLVGAWDKASGLSTAISKGLMLLANNLDTITRAVLSLVAGLALVAGGAAAVGMLTRAVQGLTAAMVANPLGAFLVVLVSVITAITLFRDKINLGVDSVTTLGDLLRAFGELVVSAFGSLGAFLESTFGPLGTWIKGLFSDIDFSLAGLLRGTASVVDFFVRLWRGAVQATVAIFEGVPPALSDIFAQALNAVLEKISLFVNKAGELLNTVTEFAGLGKIASTIDFTIDNKDLGAAAQLGTNIASSFTEGFNAAGRPAQEFLDRMFNRAAEIGQMRRAAEGSAGGTVGTDRGKPAPVPVNVKELERAQNALRSLLNTIQPSSGAVLELARAEKTLNESVRMGLISREQANTYLKLAQEYYKDTINPLAAYNRELDNQAQLLGVVAREREVEAEIIKQTQEFQKIGLPLTQQETAELRAKLQAIRDLNEATQAQDAILAATIDKRRQFQVQLDAITKLSATGQLAGGDKAQAVTDMLGSIGIDPAGTQAAADAQVAAVQTMYDRIAALRAANLIGEQDAAMLIARVAAEQNAQRLAGAQDFFGNLATLSRSGNKKLANIGKAAAVAQATIDGILAVQKALASAPPPVNYAMAAAVGVAAAANVAAILKQGYMDGGYTGNAATNEVAGVVHGREFVVNADATARNRSALEAMNRGQQVGTGQGGGGSVVSVTVNNNAAGTQATTTERDGPNGKEIEVLIEQVTARSVKRGGPLATAMESQYGLNRAAGVSR